MKNFLLILTFLILSHLGICQGTWSQTTNFPDSIRTMALTTTVGDTGYMFLGYKGSSFSYATWMYDHSSNTWTQKAPFPVQYTDPKKESRTIFITDVTGRTVYYSHINTNDQQIDIHTFSDGVYIISIKDRSGILIASEKFIVNR